LNIKPRVARNVRPGASFYVKPIKESPMTKYVLLGTLALMSAVSASPVTAQEVIYNPGYCAQFYPNANCQNKGPNNPYTGDYQRRNEIRDSFAWDAGPCAQGVRFYRGRDGRRHACY
jgi:hypothetical protein